MELPDLLRRRLWASADWAHTLAELQAETLEIADPWQRGAKLFQLGLLCEGLVADGELVVATYEKAWKATGDHRRALVRARYLCRENLRLHTAARLMEIEAAHFDESSLQLQAVLAWIDAGQRKEAEAALAVVSDKRGGDPKLAAARKLLSQNSTDVSTVERQAVAAEASDPIGAAASYLAAARRLRLAGDSTLAVRLLKRAAALDPRDESIAILLESVIGAAWAKGEYLAFIERRVSVAENNHERVDLLRRGGMGFIRRLGQPAEGATLLELALSMAYEHRLAHVPRHGAMITLLRTTLESSNELSRFLAVVDRGLAAEGGDDDALFLAMHGHQVASKIEDWSRVSRYASRLASLEPRHPLAAKNVDALAMVEVPMSPPPTPAAALRTRPPPTPPAGPSRRASERADFHAALVVKCSAQLEVRRDGSGEAPTTLHASARDISRGGVFVLSEGTFAADESLEVTVLIPGDEEWTLDIYTARCQVARIEPGVGAGCRFVDPPPELVSAIDRLIAARDAK